MTTVVDNLSLSMLKKSDVINSALLVWFDMYKMKRVSGFEDFAEYLAIHFVGNVVGASLPSDSALLVPFASTLEPDEVITMILIMLDSALIKKRNAKGVLMDDIKYLIGEKVSKILAVSLFGNNDLFPAPAPSP